MTKSGEYSGGDGATIGQVVSLQSVVAESAEAARRMGERRQALVCMLALAAYSLLRLGELCALRVGDLDWDSGAVSVAGTLDRYGTITVPKSGCRRVAFTPPAREAVHGVVGGRVDSAFLFETAAGEPLGTEMVRSQLLRFAQGVGSSVTFLSARSAGIDEFVRLGVSDQDLRFQLGSLRGLSASESADAIVRINKAFQ